MAFITIDIEMLFLVVKYMNLYRSPSLIDYYNIILKFKFNITFIEQSDEAFETTNKANIINYARYKLMTLMFSSYKF